MKAPISGLANVLCDNNRVMRNTSILDFSKKQNLINFHIVRESGAAGIMRVAKENLEMNLANAFTKLAPYLRKQETMGQILWD